MVRAVIAVLAGALIAIAMPLHGRPHQRPVRSFDCELPKGSIPLPSSVSET